MTNTIKKFKILTLIILTIGLFSLASTTPNPKWVKIGFRTVSITADHDEIIVKQKKGFYTKLKFKIVKAPLFVHNVKVVFGNGEFRSITFNKKFKAGTESKVIDLPGNKRIIKKIIMNYKTPKNINGRAVALVFGKH